MNTDRDLVIVTGVGFRLLNKSGNVSNVFSSDVAKPNIGAHCARELARAGYDVLMVSRSAEKLELVEKSIVMSDGASSGIRSAAVDLLNKGEVSELVSSLSVQKPVHLVHSVGLSAGLYKVPDDNPYVDVLNVPDDMPVMEYEVVVKSLLLLVKQLMSRFVKQPEARIVVVSSMSGIRAIPLGYSHASAKAGLHHAVRSLALELGPKSIYVSEIMPGIVNTGLYDAESVQESVRRIGRAFGYDYGDRPLPQMPPVEVAKAVKLCLASDSHIVAVAMVAKDQWPHMGA